MVVGCPNGRSGRRHAQIPDQGLAHPRGRSGQVEAFYYGFGETDAWIIADLPDNASAAAVSLAVGATGAVATETVVLLTAEEVDEAAKKSVDYRPPGG